MIKMKTAIVRSKDLFDKNKNPTLCLSALRGTGECHLCEKIIKELPSTPLKELIKKLKCKPHFDIENASMLTEYDQLLQERVVLNEKIDIIRKELSRV